MSQHDPNAPVTPPGGAAAVPVETVRPDPRAAAQEAGGATWRIIQELVKDPFAALKDAAASGAQTRLGVAVVFALAFIIASAVAVGGLLSLLGGAALARAIGFSAEMAIKSALIGAVSIVGLAGGLFAARALFKGRSEPITDLLAAGIALFPFAIVLILARFIDFGRFGLVLVVIAGSWATIMLFDYLHSVSGVQKRESLWGVPIAWIGYGAGAWLATQILF
jgi:hypothetical protein